MAPKRSIATAEIERRSGFLGNIGHCERCLGAEIGYLASGRLRGRLADVVEHQPRAFLGETNGNSFADSGADAGDDGYLVREPHASAYLETGTGVSSRLVTTLSIMP